MRKNLFFAIAFLALAVFAAPRAWAASTADLPGADEVIGKVLARAGSIAAETPGRRFVYTRVLVMEELDANGEVKMVKKKTYEVTQVNGALHPRLLMIDDKPVSEDELKKEQEETRERQETTEQKTAREKKRKSFSLTPELAELYQFKVVGREQLDGRSVLMIDFRPRSGSSSGGKMYERVLSRISGTLWVDEQDYEIAKAELALSERVAVLGGLVGSLDKFNLTLTRKRAEEGVWYNQNSAATIEGRKLFSSMRVRTREETADFHPATKNRPN